MMALEAQELDGPPELLVKLRGVLARDHRNLRSILMRGVFATVLGTAITLPRRSELGERRAAVRQGFCPRGAGARSSHLDTHCSEPVGGVSSPARYGRHWLNTRLFHTIENRNVAS